MTICPTESGLRRLWRQCSVGVLALALAGCGLQKLESGTGGFVQGFLGGVVASEPRAALVGRDILAAGGSAADAAVATALALSVTLPSQAGLAGGGVCLSFKGTQVTRSTRSSVTEAITFLPGQPAEVPASATRPSAVPAMPRGLFALHAKYGALRWAQVVSPAENMARFGVPVSRAFARDLAVVAAPLMADAEARKVFARPDGTLLGESDTLVQSELSTTLSLLRAQGPGALYGGPAARRLADAAQDAGGSLSLADLERLLPEWRGTVTAQVGSNALHFAPLPAAGGVVEAQIWNMAVDDGGYRRAAPPLRSHLLAEASMRAHVDLGRWTGPDGSPTAGLQELVGMPRSTALMDGYDPQRATPVAALAPEGVALKPVPASTGLVAVDREGNAVACSLTMNNLFGTGRVAPGTGLLLAAAPGGRSAPALLGPVLLVNERVSEFVMAAAPSGGRASASAMMTVLAELLSVGEGDLASAIARPRVHRGAEDRVLAEPGVPEAVVSGLRERGHTVESADTLGQVGAIYCPGQLPVAPATCQFQTDGRGFGLAASATE